MTIELDTQLAASTFQRLLTHLQSHSEVQNIDLMILADFCRNCLTKWYVEAAEQAGQPLAYEQARELIYGMPYSEWKQHFQLEATPEQTALYQAKQQAKNAL